MTSPDAVEQHYSGRGLAERIFAALAAEGHDTGKLTPGILAPYDEFHVGGLAATERFSGRLSLDPALRLLDVGCGACLLYTSPSPRDLSTSRMPSSA